MDINQPKKKLNQTPFNQFSEKLISLNLKKKKKKANNLDISKSPSQKKYEIDEFEDLDFDDYSPIIYYELEMLSDQPYLKD